MEIPYGIYMKALKKIDCVEEISSYKRNAENRYYLTDKNWTHGVAKHWAGFFVPNKNQYIRKYKVGKYVKFGNGDIRKIIEVSPSGQYLRIYVDGKILNAEDVGLPNSFLVLEKGRK